MFRDVAFGQFYPAKSFVHRMDPRVKILLNLLYMVAIFLVQSYFGYALMLAYLLISIFASRIPLKSVLKSVKGIIFLALFTAIINLFFVKSGNLLVDWWIFKIYDDGINFAVKMIVRLVFLVTSASLLTLTTTPVDLTHGIESLLKPLTWIKVPVDEFALIMSITLRFIPTLMDETDRIIRAQKARGACFDTGGLIARAKAFVPILIPLLVNAFRRAEELALAMNARCYEGARKRTKMKKLTFSWRDLVGALFTVLFIGGVLTLRYLPPELLESVKWMTF
ncbi:MAG: energy-coupling factor transporter transmembrane component T family protein [Christensenellales bacterium]|nr:energy-coupling factor transporter transmembrane protein EcfT [Clostridia bacterium]